VVRTMSFCWQQRRKIYGEWRFDSWPKVKGSKLRLHDERRSRSFYRIARFADDLKSKLQHKTFAALENNHFQHNRPSTALQISQHRTFNEEGAHSMVTA